MPVLMILTATNFSTSTNYIYATLLPNFLESKSIEETYSGYIVTSFFAGNILFVVLTSYVILNYFKLNRMDVLWCGFLLRNL